MPERAHHITDAPAAPGLDIELRLAHDLVQTKELKLRSAVELVSVAQRELIAARRDLQGLMRRIQLTARSAQLLERANHDPS